MQKTNCSHGIYWACSKRGAAFVANVIINWQSNPSKKLLGLLMLLEQGRKVRIAKSDHRTLTVDDQFWDWERLEQVA